MRTIKFEFSVEKFTFAFEADHEIGHQIQQTLNTIMTGISNLQSQALELGLAEGKPAEAIRVEAPSRTKRKQRKRTGTGS